MPTSCQRKYETEIAASRSDARPGRILARREAAGEAAGYDRLRAERDVMDLEADGAAARADRARAQSALAAFFAPSHEVTTLVAVVPSPSAKVALPGVDELVAHAEITLPEIAALKQEIESADFAIRSADRRPIPEPEIVVGTKSSNLAGGDVGSVFSIHASVPLFDRAKPEQALAQARRAQAEARVPVRRAVARRSWPSTRSWGNGGRPPTVTGHRWRQAPISSYESRKSATTQANAAFSSSSTRIEAAVLRGRVRCSSTPPHGRRNSSSNV